MPSNLRKQEKYQQAWTQMSINCIMNSGAFSSDQMVNVLNEKTFGLQHSAIIKEASGNLAIDPLNGINLMI